MEWIHRISIAVAMLLLALLSSRSQAIELIAKASTEHVTATIEQDGNDLAEDCKLELVVKAYGVTNSYSLKDKLFNCSIFGTAEITVSGNRADKIATAIVQVVRGGDGDHTGPIVGVFQAKITGIKKLGEQEIYDASWTRSNGVITSVSGIIWIGICSVCYDPETQGEDGGVFVPVRLEMTRSSLEMFSTLTPDQATTVMSEFQKKRTELAKSSDFKDDLAKGADSAEHRLRSLIFSGQNDAN